MIASGLKSTSPYPSTPNQWKEPQGAQGIEGVSKTASVRKLWQLPNHKRARRTSTRAVTPSKLLFDTRQHHECPGPCPCSPIPPNLRCLALPCATLPEDQSLLTRTVPKGYPSKRRLGRPCRGPGTWPSPQLLTQLVHLFCKSANGRSEETHLCKTMFLLCKHTRLLLRSPLNRPSHPVAQSPSLIRKPRIPRSLALMYARTHTHTYRTHPTHARHSSSALAPSASAAHPSHCTSRSSFQSDRQAVSHTLCAPARALPYPVSSLQGDSTPDRRSSPKPSHCHQHVIGCTSASPTPRPPRVRISGCPDPALGPGPLPPLPILMACQINCQMSRPPAEKPTDRRSSIPSMWRGVSWRLFRPPV